MPRTRAGGSRALAAEDGADHLALPRDQVHDALVGQAQQVGQVAHCMIGQLGRRTLARRAWAQLAREQPHEYREQGPGERGQDAQDEVLRAGVHLADVVEGEARFPERVLHAQYLHGAHGLMEEKREKKEEKCEIQAAIVAPQQAELKQNLKKPFVRRN